MRIEMTSWGRKIIIPETSVNSEFVYELREVRKINKNDPDEQELINRLEVPEQKAIRRLTILLFSMENFFKTLEKHGGHGILPLLTPFQTWEAHNKMDWNEWFHYQANLLVEEINGFSFEYADKSKHGWCL